jgi:hypothetical protein
MSFQSRLLLVVTALLVQGFLWASPALACCTCNSEISPTSQTEWESNWPIGSIEVVDTHIDNEFNAHETWLVKFLLEDNILPAMMLMAEQLTVGAIQQVGIIGMFFDAKQQMETQRALGGLQADIARDYRPSVGMCEFGSAAKSLAASERLGDYNGVLLAQRALDRHLGSAYAAGFGGEQYDKENRLSQFKLKYCDVKDNNGGLLDICAAPAPPAQQNKDIDYSRTLGTPWTLEVNYGDKELKPDEEDVFALENNLFGHKVFTRIPPGILKGKNTLGAAGGIGGESPRAAREAFMDMRALMAKRGVAENAFNEMVAMKSEGTGASTKYLQEMMKELGVGVNPDKPEDLEKLLGKNPSYYAQMEMLTKKIYQNPDFFTNLYDTPANVSRKEAAMDAIELIQKFDMFKSNLRAEANLSLMLENAVVNLQSRAENDFPQTSTSPGSQPVKQLDNLGENSAAP